MIHLPEPIAWFLGHKEVLMSHLSDLKLVLADITALRQAAGLLGWDQQVCMPVGGAEARSSQESALQKVCHEQATSAEFGKLIDNAESELQARPQDDPDVLLLRMLRYDYERSRKLPADFVAEDAKTSSMAQMVWMDARRDNNYKLFAPWLQKNLDLARRKVEYYGYKDKPYDALLGSYEPEMLTRDVQELFDQVRPEVVAIVKAVSDRGPDIDTSILTRDYAEAAQEQFAREVVAKFGYDFNRGRLDRATHPFASSFSRDDCRITTRFDKNFLPMCLMGTMHEAGHAMYEQNTGKALAGTNLADGCSNSLHESQSRLWENQVGRGRPFWTHYFPKLQSMFPDALRSESSENLYRALNKIEPSLIRVEADEVTYNLHIILRFELEQDLLDGKLSVSEAPEAWNAKMQEYLGITPPNDSEGVLQDIHWSMGGMGYFSTYSLGNFLSAQIFEQVQKDHPGLTTEIANGEFGTLFSWLERKVWRDGRTYFPQEQIERATGSRLVTGPYISYLRTKFGELYQLSA